MDAIRSANQVNLEKSQPSHKLGLAFGSVPREMWLLALALSLYAAFSQPTPDNIDWPEIAIGVLLVAIIGPINFLHGVFGILNFQPRNSLSYGVASCCITAIFWIGLIGGIGYQNSPDDFIRDVIPFLYFSIPVILRFSSSDLDGDVLRSLLSHLLGVTGIVYSVRHFLSAGANVGDIGESFMNSENLYFSTDPTVLFSVCFFFIMALRVAKRGSLGSTLLLVAYICASLVPLAALMLKGHRGPLGLAAILFTFCVGLGIKKAPISSSLVIVIVGVAVYLSIDKLTGLFDLLVAKTDAVGINERDVEFYSVIDTLGISSWKMLFGAGWGSEFLNPAAGGGYVNFAHFALSFFLLKAGAVGAFAFVVYCCCIIFWFWQQGKKDLRFALACSAPIIIGLAVNGSFRYLPFGLIVALLVREPWSAKG